MGLRRLISCRHHSAHPLRCLTSLVGTTPLPVRLTLPQLQYLDLYLVHWPCCWRKGTLGCPEPKGERYVRRRSTEKARLASSINSSASSGSGGGGFDADVYKALCDDAYARAESDAALLASLGTSGKGSKSKGDAGGGGGGSDDGDDDDDEAFDDDDDDEEDDGSDDDARLLATWRAMETLQRRGLVKRIGVSNFGEKRLRRLLRLLRASDQATANTTDGSAGDEGGAGGGSDGLRRRRRGMLLAAPSSSSSSASPSPSSPLLQESIRPVCNQIEVHPRLQQGPLVAYCQSEGIVVTAWSPLAKVSRFVGRLVGGRLQCSE